MMKVEHFVVFRTNFLLLSWLFDNKNKKNSQLNPQTHNLVHKRLLSSIS